MSIPIEFNDYNDAELSTVLAHLVCNMQALANDLHNSRPDVSQALDSIVDATQSIPDPNMTFDIKQLYDAGIPDNEDDNEHRGYRIAVLDRKARKINFYNNEVPPYNVVDEECKAMEGDEFRIKAEAIINRKPQ